MSVPSSNLTSVESLKSYLQKIDAYAAKLGVDLDSKLGPKLNIADVNNPIKDGKLAKLELFCMYLHARQEVLAQYLINTDEEFDPDSESEDDIPVLPPKPPTPPPEVIPQKKSKSRKARQLEPLLPVELQLNSLSS